MKKLICSIALGVIILISGCKKEGPVTTDSIPPDLRFTITGGGFTKTFTSAEDYADGQLNLKPATKYTFSLSINDAGGVLRLQLQLVTLLTLGTITGIPAAVETETSIQKIYTINGDASNPYTSYIITGDFVTPDVVQGDNESFDIFSNGRDYTPNSVHIHVPCLITQLPPGGYGWVVF